MRWPVDTDVPRQLENNTILPDAWWRKLLMVEIRMAQWDYMQFERWNEIERLGELVEELRSKGESLKADEVWKEWRRREELPLKLWRANKNKEK